MAVEFTAKQWASIEEALEEVDHEYEGELSELEAYLRVAEAEEAMEALEEANYEGDGDGDGDEDEGYSEF